jgi:hypothetical protein
VRANFCLVVSLSPYIDPPICGLPHYCPSYYRQIYIEEYINNIEYRPRPAARDHKKRLQTDVEIEKGAWKGEDFARDIPCNKRDGGVVGDVITGGG